MKLYMHYLSIHIKSMLEYKVSFLLTTIGLFFSSFTIFLSVLFLMDRFYTIEGYTLPEVILCYSIMLLSFSTAECIARGFDSFASIIANGEFDRILVRPRHPILQVLASKIELTRIGRIFQALVMFAYALLQTSLHWNFPRILTVILMWLGGTAIFCGIFILYAALCFFTLEGLEFLIIFTNGAEEFGRYPLSIYGSKILKFCTYIIPYALTQYYPFLYLTGRSQHPWYMFLPLLAFLFLIPCFLLWQIGVRHYKSTGS